MPKKKTTTKKKSTVNKAGNYTKPTMRKNLFNKIKAGSKGGKPGQWSARKHRCWLNNTKQKVADTKVKEDINTIMLRRPLFYIVFLPSCLAIIPATLAVTVIYFLQA